MTWNASSAYGSIHVEFYGSTVSGAACPFRKLVHDNRVVVVNRVRYRHARHEHPQQALKCGLTALGGGVNDLQACTYRQEPSPLL